MKLSKILRELSRQSRVEPQSMLLHECADKAAELEQDCYADVRDFHLKFDHPAPAAPDDLTYPNSLDFRVKLIREECDELCEAIEKRDLAAIAAESCDLIYVVLGTLVALGLPFLPFWRDVQRANMAKTVNPDGGKPIKPFFWKKPDPRNVLFRYRQSLREDN